MASRRRIYPKLERSRRARTLSAAGLISPERDNDGLLRGDAQTAAAKAADSRGVLTEPRIAAPPAEFFVSASFDTRSARFWGESPVRSAFFRFAALLRSRQPR